MAVVPPRTSPFRAVRTGTKDVTGWCQSGLGTPKNAGLAADALRNPDGRGVGGAQTRNQSDTERTNAAGLSTTCYCPRPGLLKSPLDGQAAHERLVTSLPAVHGQMGENPLCDTTEPDGSA